MLYRFEEFEFDRQAMELRRAGKRVDVRPSVLDLLELLILNADRVVTKDELVERLWGGRAVSDDAIAKRVSQLRRALGDDDREARLVRSIYGKGLRFMGAMDPETSAAIAVAAAPVAPSAREADGSALEPVAAADEAGTSPWPDLPPRLDERRSIAVLPFQSFDLSGPRSLLAQAFPDEIITSLSRLRWLFVIARGSTFRFPSYAHRLDEIRTELKARYCLSGTVEAIGEKIAMSVELADTGSGEQIWSERYEIAPGAVHELRQEIVGKIITSVEFEISSHEAERARRLDTGLLTAWESYHLGLSKIFTVGRQDYDGALTDFSRALELDPRMARAAAALGYVGWFRSLTLPVDSRATEVERMLRAVDTALEIDPRDPFVLAMHSRGLALTGEIDASIAVAQRAVQISPSYSIGFAALAGTQSLSGAYEIALENNQMAIDLSPLDPNFHYMCGTQIVALIGLGRFDEAAAWARKAFNFRQDAPHVLGSSLLAFHLVGRVAEGRQVAEALDRFERKVSVDSLLARVPQLNDQIQGMVREIFRSYGFS